MNKESNEKTTWSIITEGNVRGVIKGQNKPGGSEQNVKPACPPPPPQPKSTETKKD